MVGVVENHRRPVRGAGERGGVLGGDEFVVTGELEQKALGLRLGERTRQVEGLVQGGGVARRRRGLGQQVPLAQRRHAGHQHVPARPPVGAGDQRPHHRAEVVADIGDPLGVEVRHGLQRHQRQVQLPQLLFGDPLVGVLRLAEAVEPAGLGPHGVHQQRGDPALGQLHRLGLEFGVVGGLRIAQPVDEQDARMGSGASAEHHLAGEGAGRFRAEADVLNIDARRGMTVAGPGLQRKQGEGVGRGGGCGGRRGGLGANWRRAQRQYGERNAQGKARITHGRAPAWVGRDFQSPSPPRR